MWDCEPSELFDDRIVAARKAHQCGECRAPILPGEKYHNISALTEGQWYHIKVCACCEKKRCALSKELDVECIPYGCLAEAHEEWQAEQEAAK